ncbi:Helix-turn-helix domain-containing protein [Catalinimonas alkaloidigena]|uniref:Helix-turn-helix domain-containing protein n=1 Tax=Catalinimonas alkaloidigena TaxID=1075417 RepID=A0A1G9U3U2_9BACT|nr:helix-turn-helix transcriptional regulator [Catalinimonas alkaloidigena]SDM54606.1 Helix-turn-helix domain-containing protein [Catalinimonas alkaloidigena]
MQITQEMLGSRLHALRKALGKKQTEVMEQTQATQAAISRLEAGKGGSIEVLLSMINYYNRYFVMDQLFEPEFTILRRGQKRIELHFDQLILQEVSALEGEINERLNQIRKMVQSTSSQVPTSLDDEIV